MYAIEAQFALRHSSTTFSGIRSAFLVLSGLVCEMVQFWQFRQYGYAMMKHEKRALMKDVGTELNLSNTIVSFVINGKTQVRFAEVAFLPVFLAYSR